MRTYAVKHYGDPKDIWNSGSVLARHNLVIVDQDAEPEDKTFYRDFSPVVDELNFQDEQIQQMLATLQSIREQNEGQLSDWANESMLVYESARDVRDRNYLSTIKEHAERNGCVHIKEGQNDNK